MNEKLDNVLLLTTDALKDQAKDQSKKMIAELYKSAILKKYKDAFDEEFTKGEVQKKNIDKVVEFFYTDICMTICQCSTMQDDEKKA